MVKDHPNRVAVLGGDGRISASRWPQSDVRVFLARRYGGNGELRRLERALKAGTVDLLVVLARWNSHSATTRALRLCRRLGIRVEVVP